MRRMSGTWKRAGAMGLALMLAPVPGLLRPVTAWASPEFAYSADKWAALRDDVLEYGELTWSTNTMPRLSITVWNTTTTGARTTMK